MNLKKYITIIIPLVISVTATPIQKQTRPYAFQPTKHELENPFSEYIESTSTGKTLSIPKSAFEIPVQWGVEFREFEGLFRENRENRIRNGNVGSSGESEPGKYFNETEVTMLDSRFANTTDYHNDTKRNSVLHGLLLNWVEFCKEVGLVTWMAHGTMLGWLWGQQIFPWDKDLDFHMPISDLLKLFKYNNTIYNKHYLIDVNPNSVFRLYEQNNVIDARLIDTRNGMYLDITGIADVNRTGLLACKSPHFYVWSDFVPLSGTVLEGVEVWMPNRVIELLNREYTWHGFDTVLFQPYAGVWYQWDADLKKFRRVRKKKQHMKQKGL
ncbi:hypothetical protein HK098_008364 [Nowakowskiella sp. JEL0407]|nr:hypothetical protein HK098_008364 [Nowakowskiella sp. JEL0407]